jgi:hypothetical protein
MVFGVCGGLLDSACLGDTALGMAREFHDSAFAKDSD